MIYINNKEKLNKLKLNKENFYVVTDFDRTITESTSNSTWGVMSYLKGVNKEYARKRTELYNYYRPIEIDNTLSEKEKSKQMSIWWNAHINLFFEYELRKDDLERAVAEGSLKFRDGAKDFLKTMYDNNIPVIIISAGIGNVIEEFLKINNDYYCNIDIISNFIKFENGKIKSFTKNPIHSINKNIIKMDSNIKNKILEKNNILLIGDGISDLKMITKEQEKNAVTVGFLEENIEGNLEIFNKSFDIVISNNGSFKDLMKILNL